MRYTVHQVTNGCPRYFVRDSKTGKASSTYDSVYDAGALALWLNQRARGYA
jgi:hypothetical protein